MSGVRNSGNGTERLTWVLGVPIWSDQLRFAELFNPDPRILRIDELTPGDRGGQRGQKAFGGELQ